MSLRKFLGALVLGLPAASLAHILSFGSTHALGGHAHQTVLEASLAALCASMAALFFGGVYFAAGRQNGSIVASRLAGSLPAFGLILSSAGAWFGLIEHLESSHDFSLPLISAGLFLASFIVWKLAALAIRIVATLALAIFQTGFSKRTFSATLSFAPTPRRLAFPIAPTRFSRPPPHFT